jgi:hypothetical protein
MKLPHTPYPAFIQLTNLEFRDLQEYLTEIDALLKEKTSTFTQEVLDKLANDDDEARMISEFFFYHNEMKFRSVFPSQLYQSTFIAAYSVFESYFNRLCHVVAEESKSPFVPQDLAGKNIIDKCRIYLKKGFDIDLSSLNSTWNELSYYQQTRNWFVHDKSGQNLDKRSGLGKWVKDNPNIEFLGIEENIIVIADKEFIVEFCNLAEAYILDATSIVQKK